MPDILDSRGPLAAYRAEVLRWNSQINLVSRRDTARSLDGLILQCDNAFSALEKAEPALLQGPVLYCDLGSGGGLPGFVWHLRLAAEATAVQSWLVEPREKRAWFLQRIARLAEPQPCGVLCGRWGEVAAPAGLAAETALISLKALRLTDPEVLAGLATLRESPGTLPARVVIVRFHPADEAWTADLAEELGAAPEGDTLGCWAGAGAGIVVPGPAEHPPVALVVSRYIRSRS